MQSEKTSMSAPVHAVVIPRELAKRIYEYLTELQDEGPVGEGWKSTGLIADMNSLADLLDLPKSSR